MCLYGVIIDVSKGMDMLVSRSKYTSLEKKYENLLNNFVKYKSMFNFESCNNTWKYDTLMARAVKLKIENSENAYNKEQVEKLSQKLLKVTEERDFLKANMLDEVNNIVNEEVNFVFRKNSKINEELLQTKEELKWAMWYLKSLKEIYLSEGNTPTKKVILNKLKEGIPECYRDMLDDIQEHTLHHKSKTQHMRAH